MKPGTAQKRAATTTLADTARALSAQLAADPDTAAQSLVATLAKHGLLAAGIVPTGSGEGGFAFHMPWQGLADTLECIGAVDLSLARLLEGHVNVLQLVHLYGSAAQQERVADLALSGELLGIWGADDTPPVTLVCEGAVWRMSGAKRYASGVGVVHSALIPVFTGPAPLLPLVEVRTADRMNLSGWNHGGMERSLSGRYSFEGVSLSGAELVGNPGDYRREPHFVGGIWRCAAAQLGAITAIVAIMRSTLEERGHDAHPLQKQRLGRAAMQARTARLWVHDAAARVEAAASSRNADAIKEATALAAYARLVTEESALAVIELAQRAIGLSGFHRTHPLSIRAADLAVYLRQANPDAILLEHAVTVSESIGA